MVDSLFIPRIDSVGFVSIGKIVFAFHEITIAVMLCAVLSVGIKCADFIGILVYGCLGLPSSAKILRTNPQ